MNRDSLVDKHTGCGLEDWGSIPSTNSYSSSPPRPGVQVFYSMINKCSFPGGKAAEA
jgi:hypothetical protein